MPTDAFALPCHAMLNDTTPNLDVLSAPGFLGMHWNPHRLSAYSLEAPRLAAALTDFRRDGWDC